MLADHAHDVCRDDLPSWVPGIAEQPVRWVIDTKDALIGSVDVKQFLFYSYQLRSLMVNLDSMHEKMAAYSALCVELYNSVTNSTLILTNGDAAAHKEAVEQLMESYIKHVKIVIVNYK
jgi:hypothetical protein